jgi:AAA family ATP:ADP antiporter
MFVSLVNFFYPDIKKEEILKSTLFALALALIIGAYWELRMLKNLFFYMKLGFPTELGWDTDFGRSLIPKLKMMSPFVITGLVIVYTKLLDLVQKQTLFYIFCSLYGTIFAATAAAVFVSQKFGAAYVGKYPLALLGILVYLLTESFGSLVVALFWSFTASCNTTEQAKRTFPFILAIAQLGTIIGSHLLSFAFPLWSYYTLCSTAIFLVIVIIRKIALLIDKEPKTVQAFEKKEKADIFAGLKLLTTQPYLLGIFITSTLYEIIKTMLDFQMHTQASSFMSQAEYLVFSGQFATWTNLSSFLIALLGTSHIIKKYGIRFCILVSPITYSITLTALYLYYKTNPSPENLCFAMLISMIAVTSISYAVNNPAKEMMYIPTSTEAKFKVKGITDTIGSRGAKAVGSSINNSLNIAGNMTASIASLMTYGTFMGLGIISIWFIAGLYVGKKNEQLITDNQIIE